MNLTNFGKTCKDIFFSRTRNCQDLEIGFSGELNRMKVLTKHHLTSFHFFSLESAICTKSCQDQHSASEKKLTKVVSKINTQHWFVFVSSHRTQLYHHIRSICGGSDHILVPVERYAKQRAI